MAKGAWRYLPFLNETFFFWSGCSILNIRYLVYSNEREIQGYENAIIYQQMFIRKEC